MLKFWDALRFFAHFNNAVQKIRWNERLVKLMTSVGMCVLVDNCIQVYLDDIVLIRLMRSKSHFFHFSNGEYDPAVMNT